MATEQILGINFSKGFSASDFTLTNPKHSTLEETLHHSKFHKVLRKCTPVEQKNVKTHCKQQYWGK